MPRTAARDLTLPHYRHAQPEEAAAQLDEAPTPSSNAPAPLRCPLAARLGNGKCGRDDRRADRTSLVQGSNRGWANARGSLCLAQYAASREARTHHKHAQVAVPRTLLRSRRQSRPTFQRTCNNFLLFTIIQHADGVLFEAPPR